jgi:hypothetical protein
MSRAKIENATQRQVGAHKPFCAAEPPGFPCIKGMHVRARARRYNSEQISGLRCLGIEHLSAPCLPPRHLQRWPH